MKSAEEWWSKYGLVITKSSIGKIALDKNNFIKALTEHDKMVEDVP